VRQEKRRVWLEKMVSLKSCAERGIYSQWNGKFQIEMHDPMCGKRTLPITYRVNWVESGEHFTMYVHANELRENVSAGEIHIWVNSDEFVYAHEFGHCIGLPDEYSTQEDLTDTTIRYVKPDGTTDQAIHGAAGGKLASAPDATVMSTLNCNKTYPRHAWNIAIEVKDLLTEKTGRKVKCRII
jgi:type VI secretion system secreted protein VgrG